MSIGKYIFIVCIVNVCLDLQAKKFVIGTRPPGLFSNFFGALNSMRWCEKKKYTPVVYWNDVSKYYVPEGYNGATNVWEYYFKPVSTLVYDESDKLYCGYFAPDGKGIVHKPFNCKKMLECRFWGKELIDKYIRPNAIVASKIDDFYKKHIEGKKTIGIHLRGTDKKGEVKPVSPHIIFEEANTYEGYQYLVATDEQRLLDLAKAGLKGPVICYDAYRSLDGKPIHRNKPSKAQIGEEVVVEVYLLSKCDMFLHTCSNVSGAVMFFNPDMPHVMFLHNEEVREDM